MSRSIEALVDEQVRRWQLLRQKPEGVEISPVITVTGQHGALGDELSRRLASESGSTTSTGRSSTASRRVPT